MATTTYQPRIAKKYKEEVVPALTKKFSYKTVMQCPRLVKICLNQGVKGSVSDKKLIDDAVKEMTMVSGQKAVPTLSKKDIPQDAVSALVNLGYKQNEAMNAIEMAVHECGRDGMIEDLIRIGLARLARS